MSAARYAALMGLLFALAGALNTLENLLSAFLPAGMRVGLSNIVIMAAILCINLPSAAALVFFKGNAGAFYPRAYGRGNVPLRKHGGFSCDGIVIPPHTLFIYFNKRTWGYCPLVGTALRRGGNSRYCVHLCICACACFCFRWYWCLYGNCA